MGRFGAEMGRGERRFPAHPTQIHHEHRKKVYTSHRFVHCSTTAQPL